MHGRVDESLRVRDTTSAIAALSTAGYIGRSDAIEFDAAYRYLRVLEHRIQLVQLRRTHLMPVKEDALRALAKSSLGPAVAVRPSAEKLPGSGSGPSAASARSTSASSTARCWPPRPT